MEMTQSIRNGEISIRDAMSPRGGWELLDAKYPDYGTWDIDVQILVALGGIPLTVISTDDPYEEISTEKSWIPVPFEGTPKTSSSPNHRKESQMTIQTVMTDAEQLAALATTFPASVVKSRTQGGKEFTYLEHTTVVDRLRDVLGTGLSIATGQVIHYPSLGLESGVLGYVDMEVIITATFSSGKVMTVSGWGEADVLATRPLSTEAMDEGKKRGRANQPFKSAFSDGVKVAATRLGVGAYLYSEEGRAEAAADAKKAEDAKRETAKFTCQECEGAIEGGVLDGVHHLLPESVLNATRLKFHRRLCLACAAKRKAV